MKKGDKTMKKVLLSSVVALSVFAAAAPAFAADKVEKDTAPSTLKISDLESTGQVAPSAPASAATEKHPGATKVDPKVGPGEVIEKKGDVSVLEYDGAKNADTSKELTTIPGAEWFTQNVDLWNGSQHVTLKTKAGVQTVEVTNPHDGSKWFVDVKVEAGADTPSGFYATAVSGSLRPAGKADAKAPASKEEAKATEAKAGKAGSANSAEAGKALPKTSAVK
jgi:hypothetical protein